MAKPKRINENSLDQFARQYGRKKRPGSGEPNDRKFSHQIQKAIRRLPPEKLDELLNGNLEPDADDPPASQK